MTVSTNMTKMQRTVMDGLPTGNGWGVWHGKFFADLDVIRLQNTYHLMNEVGFYVGEITVAVKSRGKHWANKDSSIDAITEYEFTWDGDWMAERADMEPERLMEDLDLDVAEALTDALDKWHNPVDYVKPVVDD